MTGEPHRWYLLIGQEREGPFSTRDIQQLLAEKKIDGGIFAWRKGLDTWERLRKLEDFRPASSGHPAETGAEGEPAGLHEQAQVPTPETAPVSVAAGPMGTLSGLPFALKLAALVAALGLGAGGVYWIGDRGTSQPPDPVESVTVDPEVHRLMDRIRAGEDPRAEVALSSLGKRAVPDLMNALVDSRELMGAPSGRVRRVLIGIGPAAIAPLLPYLKEGKAGVPVRIFVIKVLGGIGGLQVISGLIETLDDPSKAVQLQAVEALGRLGPEAVPALVTQLTGPVRTLSPQARKNLARAIGRHADPTTARALQQAQALEKDPEVRQALAEALNRISKLEQGRKGASPQGAGGGSAPGISGGGPVAARAPERPMGGAAPAAAPPVNVQVHASAEARVTVSDDGEKKEKERQPEAAEKRATRAGEYLQRGEKEAALKEYRQAYLLNPLPMYYLIILELEEELPDSSRTDTASVSEEELPRMPVALEEIHEALSGRHPNMDKYADAPGIWEGRLRRATPVGRDAGRELFLVQGEGHDFVASLPSEKRRTLDLQAGDSHVWRGKVQGFRVIHQGEKARTLPVLLVDGVE